MSKNDIRIRNKRASFEFELLERFIAGIQLLGTEIKSLREGKASIADSFCLLENDELFVRNMNIQEYAFGNINNHQPLRQRKLLLHKREIAKIEGKLKNVGLTLIPTLLFINEQGIAKLEIALAKGKKLHDKRHTLKDREVKRELDRSQNRA